MTAHKSVGKAIDTRITWIGDDDDNDDDGDDDDDDVGLTFERTTNDWMMHLV